MDDQRRGEECGGKTNLKGCGGPQSMGSQKAPSGRVRPHPAGFVHVLWLLVVLSAFLFGATLVNIVIGIRVYETSTKQSMEIEKLTLSVREVQKSVLYLSKAIEETFQAEEEYDSEEPSEEGRI